MTSEGRSTAGISGRVVDGATDGCSRGRVTNDSGRRSGPGSADRQHRRPYCGSTATITMIGNETTNGSDEGTTYAVISTDCSALLDTLGNPSARAVLTAATGEPATIDDLHESCEVSRTTIYRRVNELVDLGLLEESVTLTEGNQEQRRFRTTGSEITLQVGPDGFEAHVGSDTAEPPSGGLLLDESSLEQFRIALSGKDLRFRIETNGEGGPDGAGSAQ